MNLRLQFACSKLDVRETGHDAYGHTLREDIRGGGGVIMGKHASSSYFWGGGAVGNRRKSRKK